MEAWYQAENNMSVTLEVLHGCMRFRVSSVFLPGAHDIMIIGSKTVRVRLQ